MSGFKKFLLQGNLVDLAVAFIIGGAFGTVVTTFVNWLTAKMPDSASEYFTNTENSFGAFLNAVIAFVILAAVVYFLVVMPYTKAKERFFPDKPATLSDEVVLLTEIRDALVTR